jgi:hypothetical protein
MDDYNITSLQESNNEWVSRLISILTPCIIMGCNTIYKEAYQLCVENDELDKYLMTFQNFISRIPKWNADILKKEVEKIKSESGCDYLEDLITCVHIIQLKALTCIRVGMKHKTIDLDIPKLEEFVHKVYIHLARKIYTNVYLFEENIPPLDVQRNNRELELIIRECILEAVRESIPVETILRAYLDETVEENVETVVTTLQENADNVNGVSAGDVSVSNTSVDNTSVDNTSDDNTSVDNTSLGNTSVDNTSVDNTSHELMQKKETLPVTVNNVVPFAPESTTKALTFSNIDQAQNVDNTVSNIHAPKDIETLEKISDENHARRLLEEDDGDDEESLTISDDVSNIQLDIQTLN